MTAPCEVCGPQPAPIIHTICHPIESLRRNGCGHLIKDHSPGLKCRICKTECGIDCTPRRL